VFRVSWGIWGGLQCCSEQHGTQLQDVDGERRLACVTGTNVVIGIHMLPELLSKALSELSGGGEDAVAAVTPQQQQLAHDAACAAWAVLSLDPMSPTTASDLQLLMSTHNEAVQVLLVLHASGLLEFTPPAVALSARLLSYPRPQRPSESGKGAVSFVVNRSKTASQLARLLMVVAAESGEEPGALAAAFLGVGTTVVRVVELIKGDVLTYYDQYLMTMEHLESCALTATVGKLDDMVGAWRSKINSLLPLLRELEHACVVLLPFVEQSSERARVALQLLPAITSVGSLVLDSNIDAVEMVRVAFRTPLFTTTTIHHHSPPPFTFKKETAQLPCPESQPEFLRMLKQRYWVLETKAAAKAAEAAEPADAAEAARVGSRKDTKKAEAKAKADAKAKAAPEAARKAAGGGSDELVMHADEARNQEGFRIVLQLQQYEHLGGAGANTLKLVAEVCAVVLAPRESPHTRGPAALPLLLKLESTGVLELMSRAGDWIWVLLEASAPLLELDAAHEATRPGCKAADDVPQAEQAVGTGRNKLAQNQALKEAHAGRERDVAATLQVRMDSRSACGAAAALMALAGGWLRAAHGLLGVAGAAVAEALAKAQEAVAGGDYSGASAVVDAGDAAHRFVRSLLEDTGHSNTSNIVVASRFDDCPEGSSEARQAALAKAVGAVTRKETTLAVLCSPFAAKVMALQPGVWRAAIKAAMPQVCKCSVMICKTDEAAKLLAQLDVPPKEHLALLLPSLLVRVAHEMTLVCSSIVTSVAKPEPQARVQQQQQQKQAAAVQRPGAPSRRLLPVVSDDGSSETFGSPDDGSSLGASGSDAWASVGTGAGTSSSGGGASGECSRRHSSGGGALVDPASHEAPASAETHGTAGTSQPQREMAGAPDAQSRLLDSLDAAALRGEFAIVEAIQAVRSVTGAPVSNVRIGAATKAGMGIARYHPPPMRAGVQQLARPAADGAPADLVDALECAHRECNDLLSAAAQVLNDARPALQQAAEAAEAHGGGLFGSGASTSARVRSGLSALMSDLQLQLRGLGGRLPGMPVLQRGSSEAGGGIGDGQFSDARREEGGK
jgi:uncharacterized membrane protein YgcG